MDNFKQAFLVNLNKAKEFLLKKDENSKIKYKNLTVCGAGFLVFILICIMLVPSKPNNNTMLLHPDDVTTENEEVSFDDNKAVAVSPTIDDEALQIQNKTQEELENSLEPTEATNENEPAADTLSEQNPQDAPVKENTADVESNTDDMSSNLDSVNSEIQAEAQTQGTTASTTHFLYCGKYQDKTKASESKANLALQAGFISTVVKKNSIYTLKLGPFNSRDEAVSAFNKMDSLSLVDECQLETE